MSETSARVRDTSWPLATWVAPVVPTLTLWLLVLAGSRNDVSGQSRGYLTGLVCALAVGAAGWVLTRTSSARLRGVGLGLGAGAAVTAAVVLVAVVA